MSGSGGYVLMSGTRSCTRTITNDVKPITRKAYIELMTVFHTSGSNRPARCCLHLLLKCVWHAVFPGLYPHLSPLRCRSTLPLQKPSPPINLPSAPSNCHTSLTGSSEGPAGTPSASQSPNSSSWLWFCLWSWRRAMINLLMSPSTVRPSGGPRRSASVRARRLRPSSRCWAQSKSTYSPKPSFCSQCATCTQLQALTASSEVAIPLKTQIIHFVYKSPWILIKPTIAICLSYIQDYCWVIWFNEEFEAVHTSTCIPSLKLRVYCFFFSPSSWNCFAFFKFAWYCSWLHNLQQTN